jgi:hypothetical protein
LFSAASAKENHRDPIFKSQIRNPKSQINNFPPKRIPKPLATYLTACNLESAVFKLAIHLSVLTILLL